MRTVRRPFRRAALVLALAAALIAAAPASHAERDDPGPDQPSIVGGEDATRARPWMASFQTRNGRHVCGATLVDARWAVTAAHCLSGPDQRMQLRIGSLRTGRGGEVLEVVEQTPHPGFGDGEGAFSDIAVLELAADSEQRPIPVRGTRTPLASDVQLLGWGDVDLQGTDPKTLQQLDTNLIRLSACRYATRGDLCIDDRERPGTSACFGDSGGPAVVRDENGRWELIGDTSGHGGRGPVCKGATIYTSTAHYLPWLEETTGVDLGGGSAPAATG